MTDSLVHRMARVAATKEMNLLPGSLVIGDCRGCESVPDAITNALSSRQNGSGYDELRARVEQDCGSLFTDRIFNAALKILEDTQVISIDSKSNMYVVNPD